MVNKYIYNTNTSHCKREEQMIRIDMSIRGDIWSIHLNEDSSKEGCNYLDNEIWANGDREEIRSSLERSMKMAASEENERLVPGVVERIMKCVGMRL